MHTNTLKILTPKGLYNVLKYSINPEVVASARAELQRRGLDPNPPQGSPSITTKRPPQAYPAPPTVYRPASSTGVRDRDDLERPACSAVCVGGRAGRRRGLGVVVALARQPSPYSSADATTGCGALACFPKSAPRGHSTACQELAPTRRPQQRKPGRKRWANCSSRDRRQPLDVAGNLFWFFAVGAPGLPDNLANVECEPVRIASRAKQAGLGVRARPIASTPEQPLVFLVLLLDTQ